jgi:iron complex outermembrane receptor protein
VKNIISYMKSFSRTPGNLAGGPFGGLWLYIGEGNVPGLEGGDGPGGQEFTAKQFSDELQLQGKAFGDRLQYTVGGFYSSFKHFDIIPVFVGSEIDPAAGAAGAFGLPANIVYTYNSKDISKALYAQLDYKITDALKATVGGRYTWEEVELSQATGSLFALLGISPVGVKQKSKLSAPSWTLNLQYQIDPGNMVYVAHRGSFRSGNFNGTVIPLNDANFFKSEKAKDFEVGFKHVGRLGNAPFRFNIAAYDVTVKDAQHAVYAIVGGNPAGFTLNVPEAKTTGIEVDTYIGLAPWFNITANAAYTNARYTKGVVDTSDLTGVPGSTILFDSYPDTPKFSTSIGPEFRLPVPSSMGELVLNGDLYKQSSSYFSSNEGSVTPGTKLKGYTTVNARLSWNNVMQSKFSAAIYVKNLFDKLYYVSGYAMGAAGGYNTAYPGEPRTIAGEVSVKF